MKAKSKSSRFIDTAVAVAGVAIITAGSARALPPVPAIGCQVQQGGSHMQSAVLQPDLATVWFERDSATLSDAGARKLQAAIKTYEPGAMVQFQIMGGERPNKPTDHVAIDRVTTIAVVAALSGIPADAVVIKPAEQQVGCAN